ncbi:putative RNA-directed DNA polymerase from transposon X-element [Trichonephila inaurata madagascariensis]|uniref:Putative RNA-directed DNA polymerase from transposon X-element n=1 Tax=Trichonephila inaurata madagascariensis TaxID=2747483 RepID=A0A8X6Y0Q0_9ARAC|nr:putative RNA-directed DNA polymerase from transposon X-element [Trichonephila inaurata madagascariensis]
MNLLSPELEYAISESLRQPQREAEISKNNTRKFKLPKLELTRFNGDPRDFLNFWCQFEKIHIDSDIDENDKMHSYSMQCSRFKNVQTDMQNATGNIKLELSELYDVLKSKLLSLESLGRMQEKFADFFGSPRGVVFTGSRATGLGEVQEC